MCFVLILLHIMIRIKDCVILKISTKIWRNRWVKRNGHLFTSYQKHDKTLFLSIHLESRSLSVHAMLCPCKVPLIHPCVVSKHEGVCWCDGCISGSAWNEVLLADKKKKRTKVEGSPFNASQSCDKECRVLWQKIHRQMNGLKVLPNRSLRKGTTAMTAFFMSSFFKRMYV